MKRMLLGVGNRLLRGGGVGPVVARALADSDWIAVDCGGALENVAGIVSRERPDLPVIVDAANMNQASGASRRLLAGRQRLHADLPRHGLPLSFVVAHIESAARKTVLIGIKPVGLPFGEELPPVVEAAARALNELPCRNDLDEIPQQEFHL